MFTGAKLVSLSADDIREELKRRDRACSVDEG
jgi:hypothetical protein